MNKDLSLKMDCSGEKTLPLLTLVNEKTRKCYDVLRKKINLVGRAGFSGDFEIPGDSSISRCHAEIFYEKQVVNNKSRIFLKLTDKKSKFGTFLNEGISLNERITSERPIVLSSGDRIRFGVMDSIWIVTEYPIVVCPSTLRRFEKETLTTAVTRIGGEITREWTDQCTHLCMNSINVTQKVLLCLASAKSIVPIKYFIDLHQALLPNSMTELPFCTDYTPDLTENLLNPNIVSMNVNNKRTTLFSGKTFVCSTMDQYNRVSAIIKIAGGEIINYCEDMSDDEIVHKINSEEFILLQQDPSNTENSKKYQQLLEKLKLMNKTPISENDIGLAVIYSNTTKHCNPDYHHSLINLQTQPSVTESQASVILANETEVLIVEDSTSFSVNVVPDSLSHMQPCFKRPLDVIMDSEEIVMPKKRVFYSNDIENPSTALKTRPEDNLEPITYKSQLTPSSSNHTNSHYNNTIVNNESIKLDSCVTTVQNSPNSSNNNDYSSMLQTSIANENLSNTNSVHSETINNRASIKRKISSVVSMSNNEDDDDPFNYKDLDEIEEQQTKKKSKTKPPASLFYSMLQKSSSTKSELSKSVEPNVNNTVDPNFIMDLLSSAKGTGKCIDTSNLDKSSTKIYEDDYLLNSVIVETVNLVISKSKETEQMFQGSNSNLKNFKKFKRKAKPMQIPHIVPMHLI